MAGHAQYHQHFQRVTKLGNIILVRAGRPEIEAHSCTPLSCQAMDQKDGELPGFPLPPIQAYLPWLLPEDRGCSTQWESQQCVSGKSASHWDVGREAFNDFIT